MSTITVPSLATPTRLDKFLVEKLPNLSRHVIQQNIKQGLITVNAKNVTVHHWLKTGELINLPDNLNPAPARQLTPNTQVPWRLIAETTDYLVIDKPAGITVHPAPGVKEPTLVEGLLARYPEIKNIGDNLKRPGLVHRLDKAASGLMVVARQTMMFDYLKTQFQKHLVNKEYLALVIGKIDQPSGTISFNIGRSKLHRYKMAALPKTDTSSKSALTNFTVLKQYQAACLLKVNITTGRTHQIRAHLNAYGHPLVGDPTYYHKHLSFKNSPGRLFLHATRLGFYDLNHNWQEFVSSLPDELTDFLNKLK